MRKNNLLKASFVQLHLNTVMCENNDMLNMAPIAPRQVAFLATELTLTYNCGVVITGIAGDRVKFTRQMDTNYAKLLYAGETLVLQSQNTHFFDDAPQTLIKGVDFWCTAINMLQL